MYLFPKTTIWDVKVQDKSITKKYRKIPKNLKLDHRIVMERALSLSSRKHKHSKESPFQMLIIFPYSSAYKFRDLSNPDYVSCPCSYRGFSLTHVLVVNPKHLGESSSLRHNRSDLF